MKRIKLHRYQKQAIFSDKRIVAMIAGLQSGKTFSGATWTRMQVSTHTDPDDCFIVASPTYSIFSSSTLPAFMRLHADMGELYRSPPPHFKFKHGPIVYFRSMDNPWSAEGITRCRAIWGDEAGLFSTQAFINLMGRAAPFQAPIFLSTTPYNLHNYLYRDLYEPWKAGERSDVEIVQFRSIDNPYFPAEEFERQKRLLDPRMFSMRYEGQFERMAGLVYSDFNWANYEDAFPIDRSKFHVFGGIDWGYTDPFAIVVRAIGRDGVHDYQIGEYACSGHTPDEQISIAKQYRNQYGIEQFFADGADPGMIALFQKAGLPIAACSNKDINYGISVHNGIIRTNQYKIFRGLCPVTEKEYESYQYKDFDLDGSLASNKPLDINNHLMDANRYITVDTQWLRDKAHTPFVPAKTHLQRLLTGEGEYAEMAAESDDW